MRDHLPTEQEIAEQHATSIGRPSNWRNLGSAMRQCPGHYQLCEMRSIIRCNEVSRKDSVSEPA